MKLTWCTFIYRRLSNSITNVTRNLVVWKILMWQTKQTNNFPSYINCEGPLHVPKSIHLNNVQSFSCCCLNKQLVATKSSINPPIHFAWSFSQALKKIHHPKKQNLGINPHLNPSLLMWQNRNPPIHFAWSFSQPQKKKKKITKMPYFATKFLNKILYI
jgi:hypothetical protein